MTSKLRSGRCDVPWLNNPLEIHLEPFTYKGKTYRVIGTQTNPHMQKLMNVETGEWDWIEHARVKRMQTLISF